MEIVRIILAIFFTLAIILFLSRLDHHRHPETYCYGWIGGIVVLVVMWICV
jgi:hypothetical protein